MFTEVEYSLEADMIENGTEPCIHYGNLFTKYNEAISVISSETNKIDGFCSKVGGYFNALF